MIYIKNSEQRSLLLKIFLLLTHSDTKVGKNKQNYFFTLFRERYSLLMNNLHLKINS
jgi:hypothetical protein